MKKNFTTLMLIAVAAMAISSCNEVAPQVHEPEDVITAESRIFHITASPIETKSVFGAKEDNSYPTIWTTNKSVAFSRDEAAFVEGAPTLVNDGTSATFEVELAGEATEGTIYAFSPKGVYDKDDASNNVPGFTSINANNHYAYLIIPSEQTPLASSVDESAQALVGAAEYKNGTVDLTMNFSHVVAYGKMAITNFAGGDIASVELTFPENVVGGSCRYSYAEDNVGTISNMSGNTITLDPTNVADNTFWFALAPTLGKTGLMKIAITDNNDDIYIKTLDLSRKALPFNIGKVSSFTANFNNIVAETEANAIFTISTLADANEWENAQPYNMTADDNRNTRINITYNGGGNNGKYYNTDESWRLYKDGGGMTIASPCGDTITKIEISKSEGILSADGYNDDSGIWAGSASSVEFSASATTRIQKIKVWYDEAQKVDVTNVELNNNTLDLEVGKSKTLVATVYPDNATNKGVTWTSNNEEVATVDENGKVEAIAEGEATIYATSIDNSDKYDTCEVTVSAASGDDAKYVKVTSDSDLTDGQYLIVCEDQNVAFDGGLETLDASSNTVDVTINNGEIDYSKSLEAAEFTFTASDGSFKSTSGKYIGNSSDSNALNTDTSALTNTVMISEGNASIKAAGGSYLRYNATSGQDRFRYFKSGTYTAQKAIQLYKRIGSSTPTPVVTLTSIAVKTEPTKLTYTEGDKFDPTGLVITKTMSDNSTEDVSYSGHESEFSFNPSLTTELTTSDTAIKITYGGKSVNLTITVNAGGGQGGTSTVHLDGSGLTTTATTEETNIDQDGITYVLSKGAKSQSSTSATNAFTNAPSILIGKSGAYIYNSTSLGKKITGFKIYANAGASTKVSVSVTFGTQANPTGNAQYTATLSVVNSVYDCSELIPANANYFVYKVTNANNSQVQFEITYEN